MSSFHPITEFHFKVVWDDVIIHFQEVTGLDTKSLRPGIKEGGSVQLKRGIFADGTSYWDWYSRVELQMNTKTTITIQLMNENDQPTIEWILNNAHPTKITSGDLNAEGNSVVINSVEIAYGKLMIRTQNRI